MKLLEVGGHVPQCPIAGDATDVEVFHNLCPTFMPTQSFNVSYIH